MGFFSRWRIHKRVAKQGQVEVSERNGIRRLHLGGDTVQSAMRVSMPDALEIAYTRSMMAFLLFQTRTAEILMIGLGGGSTAKWLYRQLPAARITVVEINPEVIPVAHNYFYLPTDPERLPILVGEGAEYIAQHPHACDALLVDGYDEVALAPSLATAKFFTDCRLALKPHGVFVMNLWGSDPKFREYVDILTQCFDGLLLCLPAAERGNIAVLGFERSPNMPTWDALKQRARELEALHGLEFLKFVDGLQKMNLHSEKRLII